MDCEMELHSKAKISESDPEEHSHKPNMGVEIAEEATESVIIEPEDYSKLAKNPLLQARRSLVCFYLRYKELIGIAAVVCLLAVFTVYIGFAISMGKFWESFYFALLVYTVALYNLIKRIMQKNNSSGSANEKMTKIKNSMEKSILVQKIKVAKLIIFITSWVAVVFVVGMSCRQNPYNLVSLSGLLFLFLFATVFSRHPELISLRVVLAGLNIQFVLGILITRTDGGAKFFRTLGLGATLIKTFTDAGSVFIFGSLFKGCMKYDGDEYCPDPGSYFAFAIHALPLIVVYSSFASILYHFGVMQFVIKLISFFIVQTLGTSAPETLNAAANIFMGQTEAPLLIRPLLPTLTKSELHAVMTGGFATIAGAVLAIYTTMGIDASALIAASVMNAPAALVFSKIICPETKKIASKSQNEDAFPRVKYTNVFEAAARGASDAVMFVLNVAMNLIAFIAILAMMDGFLGWSGGLVGYPEFSVKKITSVIFYPLTLMIGVEAKDATAVAELIGTKTVVNEFVAYLDLSALVKAGAISVRSATLSTFALCGFANFASLGVQIGGIGSLIPSRVQELSSLSVTALLCGSFACFSNACIMGLLYRDNGDLALGAAGAINATAIAAPL